MTIALEQLNILNKCAEDIDNSLAKLKNAYIRPANFSIESAYQGKSLSLESIGEFFSKIWEAIKAFFKRIFDFITGNKSKQDHIQSVTEKRTDRVKTEIDDIKIKAREYKIEVKYSTPADATLVTDIKKLEEKLSTKKTFVDKLNDVLDESNEQIKKTNEAEEKEKLFKEQLEESRRLRILKDIKIREQLEPFLKEIVEKYDTFFRYEDSGITFDILDSIFDRLKISSENNYKLFELLSKDCQFLIKQTTELIKDIDNNKIDKFILTKDSFEVSKFIRSNFKHDPFVEKRRINEECSDNEIKTSLLENLFLNIKASVFYLNNKEGDELLIPKLTNISFNNSNKLVVIRGFNISEIEYFISVIKDFNYHYFDTTNITYKVDLALEHITKFFNKNLKIDSVQRDRLNILAKTLRQAGSLLIELNLKSCDISNSVSTISRLMDDLTKFKYKRDEVYSSTESMSLMSKW